MRRPLSPKELDRLQFAKNSIHVLPDNEIHPTAKISRFAFIGEDGFGLARNTDGTLVEVNHAGNVRIGAHVVVRVLVTIDRAVAGSTIIGDGTAIDHHCHIAHNVVIGEWNTFAAHCVIEGSCVIGSHNTFGAGVIVQRKVKIGNNCIFGSGCVVTKDVPDDSVMAGNPAKLLRKNE